MAGTGLIPPLTYRPGEFKELVLELGKRGYQIMTHTLRGDTARMVLDTYEQHSPGAVSASPDTLYEASNG